ncbi:MAG: SAM hydrolase/SAM-dependent halogenase family protein [Mycobacteriales bacterium]
MAGSPASGARAGEAPRWLAFVSDYGLEDHLVGVCKGVIAKTAPTVRVIDVCHYISAQNVDVGARVLAETLPYLPQGIVLALVDPFRREPARAVAIRCGNGQVIVAPDNGLASLAWAEAGGVEAAREATNADLWTTSTPASSFRGRDVFAPVAAHLAAGTPFEDVGVKVDPATLVELRPATPYVHGDHVHCSVRMTDHFGNLALNLQRSDLEACGIGFGDEVELRYNGKSMRVPFTSGFSDVSPGRTFVYEDSFRALTIVTVMGRAAETLRASYGDPIVLARVAVEPIAAGGKMRVVDAPPSTATA